MNRRNDSGSECRDVVTSAFRCYRHSHKQAVTTTTRLYGEVIAMTSIREVMWMSNLSLKTEDNCLIYVSIKDFFIHAFTYNYSKTNKHNANSKFQTNIYYIFTRPDQFIKH